MSKQTNNAKIVLDQRPEFKIGFELNEVAYKEATQKVYKRSVNKFRVPGFRKGKAPLKMVQNHYGDDVFMEEAVNEMFHLALMEALDELELSCMSDPEVALVGLGKSKNPILEVAFETYPEFTLPEINGRKVEIEKQDKVDEIYQRMIDSIREEHVVIEPVNDKAKEGDIVVINVQEKIIGHDEKGDDPVKDMATNQHVVLGDNRYIKEIEEALYSAKSGDKLEVKSDFRTPEEEGAEKIESILNVEVLDIKRKVYPEFDDEFVSDISEYETVLEYEKNEKELVKKGREIKNKLDAYDALVVDLSKEIKDIKITEKLRDKAAKDSVQRQADYLESMNVSFNNYLGYINMTVEDLILKEKENIDDSLKHNIVDFNLPELLGAKFSKTEKEEEEKYKKDEKKVSELGEIIQRAELGARFDKGRRGITILNSKTYETIIFRLGIAEKLKITEVEKKEEEKKDNEKETKKQKESKKTKVEKEKKTVVKEEKKTEKKKTEKKKETKNSSKKEDKIEKTEGKEVK